MTMFYCYDLKFCFQTLYSCKMFERVRYAGFVRVMENLESHGIQVFQFPGLESHVI